MKNNLKKNTEEIFYNKHRYSEFTAITNSYSYSVKVKPLNLLVCKIAVCREHGYNENTAIAK